jgi:hypothetical protein
MVFTARAMRGQFSLALSQCLDEIAREAHDLFYGDICDW